jgi:peroxin-14
VGNDRVQAVGESIISRATMAPREDLVSSAVTFLRDPSVASSPVEKRMEFLKSKNLTQEEIEISLARAAEDPNQPAAAQNAYYPPSTPYRGPPQGAYNNYPMNPYGQFPQPPPEPPRRDWRDWFIMATVVGGAGYGLWMLADRYVKPLIAPPTPPQLEQDKAAIDEQFNKAFTLLDTLSQDTEILKKAEEERTQRLDSAISDIESIISELKSANAKREDDSRRMENEIRTMKDSLPRSIDNVRDANDRQLKELSAELGSLKLLMNNRLGGGSSSLANIAKTQPANISSVSANSTVTPSAEVAPGSSGNVTGVNGPGKAPSFNMPTSSASSASVPSRPAASTSFGSGSGKAAIPAWQMAAQNKQKDFNIAPTPGAPVNGAASLPQDGADAVTALNAS